MKRKMKSICDLNAEAVRFLEDGENSAAVKNLEVAIDRLRAQLYQSEADQVESPQNDTCDQEPDNTGDITQPLYSVPIDQPRYLSNSNNQATDNLFHFYSRAFVFTKAGQPDSRPPLREFVVLLFNLALAHHEEGIYYNTPSLLAEALEFYEMAVDIMKSLSSHMDDYDLLLLMAVVNNMGHIHSHLLNFQEMREKLELVQHLVAVASKRSNESSIRSIDEYEFIFEVATVHDGRELSIAPAA